MSGVNDTGPAADPVRSVVWSWSNLDGKKSSLILPLLPLSSSVSSSSSATLPRCTAATPPWPSARWSSPSSSSASSWWTWTSSSKWSTGSGAWVPYVWCCSVQTHTCASFHHVSPRFVFCAGPLPRRDWCRPLHHNVSDHRDWRSRGRRSHRRRGQLKWRLFVCLHVVHCCRGELKPNWVILSCQILHQTSCLLINADRKRLAIISCLNPYINYIIHTIVVIERDINSANI